jgi:hypothetical protein
MTKEQEPVVIYTASDFMEASQIRADLVAAGFMCDVLNVQHTTMMLGGGLVIGIRLIVPASQAQAAREFLENRGDVRILGPQE